MGLEARRPNATADPSAITLTFHRAVMNWPRLPLAAQIVHAALWTLLGCRSGTLKTSPVLIAAKTPLSERRVREGLDRLEAPGLVETVDRDPSGCRIIFVRDPDEAARGRIREPSPQGELLLEDSRDDEGPAEPPAAFSVLKTPAAAAFSVPKTPREDAPHWESEGEERNEKRRAHIRSTYREAGESEGLSPPPTDNPTDAPAGVDACPRSDVDRYLADGRARADLAANIAERLKLDEEFRGIADWTAGLVFSAKLTTNDLETFIGRANAVAHYSKSPAGKQFASLVKKHLAGDDDEASQPQARAPTDAPPAAAPAQKDRRAPRPRKEGSGERTLWTDATEAQIAASRFELERHESRIEAERVRAEKTIDQLTAVEREALRAQFREARKVALAPSPQPLNPDR